MGTNIAVRQTSYRWPDTITALMQWDNGATGKTTTTFAPQRTKFHSLNVYGTRKTFVNDMPNAHLFSGDDHQKDHQLIETPYPGMQKGDLLPDFINCIRQGRRPNINERDIFRVMCVCFAIWESLQSKRQIDVNYLV